MPDRIPRWVDALWLALLALYILAGATLVPFHGDESTLIFMGRDFHHTFVDGHLSKILYDHTWSARPHEQKLRLENGTISKTIYGWLAWNQGYGIDDFNSSWHWGRDYEFNLRSGSLPDSVLLNAARLASAIQLALAAALFFQFTRITLSRPTAYVASALFALHPNVLINGRRAMMEGSHLLGLMLVLLAAAWLLRERKWWGIALLGVCMGLAVAAKHPNVIACALAASVVFWALLRKKTGKDSWPLRSYRQRALFCCLLLFVAALVFLLLNPAWWSAPLELPGLIIEMRAELLRFQVDLFGGYGSFGERVQGLFQYAFAAEHQYFEVESWAGYDVISAQIKTYERSGLAGILIGGTGLAGLLYLGLAAYGAISLSRSTNVAADHRDLLLVWILGTALATLLLTPLPWARYYLPLAPALALLAAQALVDLSAKLRTHFYRETDGVTVLD